ncbi:50S ribosomal protein L6 [Candidatus Uhrbacteria bacterium]|nr:50S ribosomal protein L6 [Candidatus Uhrbacteria bacterium]
MSRIGKAPISVPAGVTAAIEPGRVVVRGPKGAVTVVIHPHVTVLTETGVLRVEVARPESKSDRSLWGLSARLLQNAITGVTTGFDRKLEITGVGYRVEVKGRSVVFHLGYSHPITEELPEGIAAVVEKNTITISGVDKQLVGAVAARFRSLRKPDAYHGKGVRYAGEVIKLKPGKTVKAGGGA